MPLSSSKTSIRTFVIPAKISASRSARAKFEHEVIGRLPPATKTTKRCEVVSFAALFLVAPDSISTELVFIFLLLAGVRTTASAASKVKSELHISSECLPLDFRVFASFK